MRQLMRMHALLVWGAAALAAFVIAWNAGAGRAAEDAWARHERRAHFEGVTSAGGLSAEPARHWKKGGGK